MISRSRALLPPRSLGALLAAFVALVVITLVTYRALESRREAAAVTSAAAQSRNALNRLLLVVEQAQGGQRGFLLTADPSFLRWQEVAAAMTTAHVHDLRRLLAGQAQPLRQLSQLEQLVSARLAVITETIQLERAGQHEKATTIVREGRGRAVMDALRELGTQMLDAINARIDRDNEALADAARWSSYVTFGGSGLLLALLLLLGMLASRDYRTVEEEGWVRRLQIELGQQVQADYRVESLGEKILDVVVPNAGAQIAALYAVVGDGLVRIAGHALPPDAPARLGKGEGLVGQAALEGRLVHLTKVPAEYLAVSSAVGRSVPRQVVVVPASADGRVHAVLELGFLGDVDATTITAVERMAEVIANALRSAQDRSRLEDLLAKTQQQSEELQVQQEELRTTNEELEQQSKALQLSQAQLENQQSELEQVNSQLEEQTSSLERQRDELAATGSALQRASEYKSQFLANMSHELRTPLNSSLILAKLLADNRDGNLNEEQIKFAATIYTAGNDLLTLINDILDLSKIEAGMLEVRDETVALDHVLDDLRDTFTPVAAPKQLAFELVRAEGVPTSLVTDGTRLMQILRNLLSNALKFTDKGGVRLVIDDAGESLAFAIQDTGIGIPHEQQDAIFEPFRQVDGGSTRKFGGTGLGLSISRDLAKLLGGELRLHSVPGQGSTFTLVLPKQPPARQRAARPAAGPERPRPQQVPLTLSSAARPSSSTTAPSRMGPFEDDRAKVGRDSRSLLIIEDDVPFARIMNDLARELDFLTIVTTSGDDGLALARAHSPSAIVLDIGLPDRSGLAVLDALKRDPKTRHIPVHVVSGHDYARTALEMGAAGYALKPVVREQLADALKKLEERFTRKLRRVLVVEDDPVLRESTARLLGTEAVETVTAATAAEALEHVKTTTFDCMVLDLSLPDRSGLELLDDMSRGEQYGFPPVIVYTGKSLSTDQVHELERFSQSIIIKGARSPERLLDEVTLFLHQVESELPPERQRMLRDARSREAVFEGRRILIVEDDVRNVFALTAVLEPKGAVLGIARNGREALAYLRDQPEVDLVLMDIMMPEMDGLEATQEIRKQPQFAKLPIIALTAKAMSDDRDRCLQAGANDYIAKPLDVDKLLSLARVWIRQ